MDFNSYVQLIWIFCAVFHLIAFVFFFIIYGSVLMVNLINDNKDEKIEKLTEENKKIRHLNDSLTRMNTRMFLNTNDVSKGKDSK